MFERRTDVHAGPPTTEPDRIASRRRFLGRALPVIAFITYVALIALLVTTVSTAIGVPRVGRNRRGVEA